MSSMNKAGTTALLLVMLAGQAGAQQAQAVPQPQPLAGAAAMPAPTQAPGQVPGQSSGIPMPVPTPHYQGGMVTGGSADGSVAATGGPQAAPLPTGPVPVPPDAVQGYGVGTLPQGYAQAYPVQPGYPPAITQGYGQLPAVVAPGQGGLPPVLDPNQLTAEQIEAYNEAIRQVFPMNPDLIRLYMDAARRNQQAILEKPQPAPAVETSFVRLEPGEEPPVLNLAEGIATAVNFFDSTGQPWPVTQYVLGSEKFQVIQLGRGSNSLTLSPLTPVGWGNVVVRLEGLDKPVSMSLLVSNTTADFNRNIQVMQPGPRAVVPPPPPPRGEAVAGEAGNRMMMKVVEGVDIPDEARAVPVGGVEAKAWLLGEELYVRSRHRLSTQFLEQMAGPGGINAYRLKRTPLLMFIVDGRVVAANVTLP